MTDVASTLLHLNIFRNYIDQNSLTVAISDRGQIVVASANVVKTTIVSDKRNYYKMLLNAASEFEITDLSFNISGTLLALIGKHNISICDTKSLPVFDGKSVIWDTFYFQIGPFENTVKSVKWHPASALGSEIVVLTDREILLFNVVLSIGKPMVSIKFADYPELNGKTIESITFGSADNFGGSITLYLTTSCGLIYAISPFVHQYLKIKATKRLATEFVNESKQIAEEMEHKFPPVALLHNPQAAALYEQLLFAEDIEKQLHSPYYLDLEDEGIVTLAHTAERFGFRLQGPIAVTGKNAKMILVGSNDIVSVLACVHSDKGKAVFSYFAQLQPLIMGWDKLSSNVKRPEMPRKAPAKEMVYSKPKRGFGYVIDSDSEDDSVNAEQERAAAQYKEELEVYQLKKKVAQYFEENFNKLTQFATDNTSSDYNGEEVYFRNVEGDKFMWLNAGQLVFGNPNDFIQCLFYEEDFGVEYKTYKVSPTATGFAYYKDTVGGLGSYAIVDSSREGAEVIQLEVPVKQTTPLLEFKPLSAEKAVSSVDTGVLTEELAATLNSYPKALPPITDFNPESTKSLTQVLAVANAITEHTGAYTKFMLALQLKIQTQLQVLRMQIEDLKDASKLGSINTESNRDKIEQLTLRQESIADRMNNIKKSVLDRFEKIKLSHDLPLSSAEKAWFREINNITKLVQIDDNENVSLVSQFVKLRNDVSTLAESVHKESELGADAIIEKYAMGNELSRLRRFLEIEGKGISRIEQKMSEMQQTLEVYGV